LYGTTRHHSTPRFVSPVAAEKAQQVQVDVNGIGSRHDDLRVFSVGGPSLMVLLGCRVQPQQRLLA
jgi:hypothetical protein